MAGKMFDIPGMERSYRKTQKAKKAPKPKVKPSPEEWGFRFGANDTPTSDALIYGPYPSEAEAAKASDDAQVGDAYGWTPEQFPAGTKFQNPNGLTIDAIRQDGEKMRARVKLLEHALNRIHSEALHILNDTEDPDDVAQTIIGLSEPLLKDRLK